MPSYFATVILVLYFSSYLINEIYASPSIRCPPCLTPEECKQPPDEVCPWGEHTDFCGRRKCSKGPGDRCGGVWGILGVCGEGMMCKGDERCYGCSTTTMQCFTSS